MNEIDKIRYNAATVVFKLASKTLESGMHRTINREPKGKGWIQCQGQATPKGLMCKPLKVKESIEYFKIAYEIYPDIVAINQIALGYELIGEKQMAIDYFNRMESQAKSENNDAYRQTAKLGLKRCKSKNKNP